MSRLQKKPPAHKRAHPTLQNMIFFLLLWVIFALLDPDPYSNYGSGSGSNGPMEYGSNPDLDPKHWFRRSDINSIFHLPSQWDLLVMPKMKMENAKNLIISTDLWSHASWPWNSFIQLTRVTDSNLPFICKTHKSPSQTAISPFPWGQTPLSSFLSRLI